MIIEVYERPVIDRVSPNAVLNNDDDVLITLAALNACPPELDYTCNIGDKQSRAIMIDNRTFTCLGNFKSHKPGTVQIGLSIGGASTLSQPVTVLDAGLKFTGLSPLILPVAGSQIFTFTLESEPTGL